MVQFPQKGFASLHFVLRCRPEFVTALVPSIGDLSWIRLTCQTTSFGPETSLGHCDGWASITATHQAMENACQARRSPGRESLSCHVVVFGGGWFVVMRRECRDTEGAWTSGKDMF